MSLAGTTGEQAGDSNQKTRLRVLPHKTMNKDNHKYFGHYVHCLLSFLGPLFTKQT